MSSLYEHTYHEHEPKKVKDLHQAEMARASFNTRVAVGITRVLSAMPTFWVVALVIALWIAASYTPLAFDKMPWPLLLTILNIPQISMMIGLGVGQGVLGRKQELQSEEQYKFVMKTYHDIEGVMAHLSAQDEELVKQSQQLLYILQCMEHSRSRVVRRSIKAVTTPMPALTKAQLESLTSKKDKHE